MLTGSAHTSLEALHCAREESPSANNFHQPTHRARVRSWRFERRNSSRCPARRQELFHCGGNLHDVRLGGKMARIQELYLRVRYIFSKCEGPGGDEKRIVHSPNREQRRLRLAKVVLKRRVQLHIRCVVEEQIQLDVFIPRTFEKGRIQGVSFRRNALRIAYSVRVLPSGSFQRQDV